MEGRSHREGLIRHRRNAVIALVLTGLVAAMTFRAAFLPSPRHAHWLIPLDSLLPMWALWAVNVAFYTYLLWVCVVFLQVALGKERVLVAGWFLLILLSPIQSLVSTSAAAAIQYIKAVSIAVAFVAVLLLVLGRANWRQHFV
jgi:hypothetical protein